MILVTGAASAVYEPPWPRINSKEQLERLRQLAQTDDWDRFAVTFFRDTLSVPDDEVQKLRATEL